MQRSTALTTHTVPSQTTQMCGCLEGDMSTRTSSARTNMLNTTSTVTCRTNWVGALSVYVIVCILRVSGSRKGFTVFNVGTATLTAAAGDVILLFCSLLK